MAAIERAFVAQPIASAGGRIIASPFQFYTTGEERLRISSVNSLTGVRVKVQARVVDTSGTIQANSWDHVPNSNRTVASDDFELGVGAVLNVTVFAASGTPLVGQTFVIVQIVRGFGAAAIVLGTMLAGYVTNTQHLAWPGSPIVSSTEGEPFVRTIVGTLPLFGVEMAETVPAGARWELLTVYVELVCDAQVATRRPRLTIQANGVQVTGRFPMFQTLIASDDFAFCFASTCIASSDGAGNFTVPFPNGLIVQAGGIISTSTAALQSSDHWLAPIIQAREWLEVT